MTIETKHDPLDKVWLLKDNRVTWAYVSFLTITSGNLIGLPDPYIKYSLGSAPISGLKDMGEYHESKLFPTKEALLQSL